MPKKILCPICHAESRWVYDQYISLDRYRHDFYRCLNPECLYCWNRTLQLRKNKKLKHEIVCKKVERVTEEMIKQ